MSAKGNFFGSTIVALQPDDPPPQTLSLAAGLALAEAVDAAVPGQAVMLKWPNDVLLGGDKLAGILLERSGERVAVGFGVNLAAGPLLDDRRVADLGGAISPKAFAPLLAASFARQVARWRSRDLGLLVEAWLARAHPPGTRLMVHVTRDEIIAGCFAGLDPDGGLRLTLDDGSERRVHAADVDLA